MVILCFLLSRLVLWCWEKNGCLLVLSLSRLLEGAAAFCVSPAKVGKALSYWFSHSWTPCFLPSNHSSIYTSYFFLWLQEATAGSASVACTSTEYTGKHWKGFLLCSLCSLEPKESLLTRRFPAIRKAHIQTSFHSLIKINKNRSVTGLQDTTSSVSGNRYNVFIT